MLGLGALGGDVAEKLVALGFRVSGWSRTAKDIAGVDGFAGRAALAAFLSPCDVVCCLLPLTAETRGMLDAAAFSAMKPGAYLINSARGGHVVEADLLAALETGHIAGATLDVFQTEPLPDESPFWDQSTRYGDAACLVGDAGAQLRRPDRRELPPPARRPSADQHRRPDPGLLRRLGAGRIQIKIMNQ